MKEFIREAMSITDDLPTIWPIEAHTVKKHEILSRYLDAWIPILGQTRGRIIAIDGFAGPGIYSGGEDGSPIVALNRAVNHQAIRRIKAEILFLFIEIRKDRATNLNDVLADRFPKSRLVGLPIKYAVIESDFAGELTRTLDDLQKREVNIAPTLAILDPFGFSGVPMSVITRLLGFNACEVLITFMEGFVNRFAGDVSPDILDELFGNGAWRAGLKLLEPSARKEFWLTTYQKNLEVIGGAVLVRSFEMINQKNQTEYFLVFGTKHWRGLEVMKEAMWKIDPTGLYRFSDLTDPSQRLLLDYANEPLWGAEARKAVAKEFKGRTVTVGEIHRFVIEGTPYLFRKKLVLWALEDEGIIIDRPKRHSYADDRGKVTFAL